MTAREWNAGIEYLQNGEIGNWIENGNRKVIIENMTGGRYLLLEKKEVCGLVNEEWRAMEFLRGTL